MAISATFLADFSDFLGEADKADAKLKALKEGAEKVGPALDRATAGDYVTKFSKLGTEATTAAGGVQGLGSQLGQVDRVLATVGVSLGPIPGALSEISAIAGGAAGKLGLLGTAALGVAGVIGGWKLGTWLGSLKDVDKTIGDLTAKLLGMGDVAGQEAAAGTETLARASANAGRTVTDLNEAIRINTEATIPYSRQLNLAHLEVDKLTEADRRQIEAAQELGKSQAEITARFGISEGALKLLTERTRGQEEADRKAAAEAKKHADEMRKQSEAMAEVHTATQGYSTTIAQLEPKLTENIRLALEAGVAQGTLATAYGVTEGQVRAVAKALDVEAKAAEDATKRQQEWAKTQVQATQEAGKLWGDYHELVVAQGGTAVDQQIAQIERWKYDTIAAMKEAGTYNEETMTAIEAVAGAKLDAIGLDWDGLAKESKRALEQTAEAAEANYNYVAAHSDQFTEKQIEDRRRERDAAISAVQEWGQQAVFTLETVQEESKETARTLTTSWNDAMDAVRRGQGTMTGSISSPGNVLAGKPPSQWGGIAAEMGGVVRFDDYNNPFVDTSGGMRGSASPSLAHTSYADLEKRFGGPFGLSAALMMPFTGSGHTTNINVNTVMGDKHEIARVVKDALADDWRSSGQRA